MKRTEVRASGSNVASAGGTSKRKAAGFPIVGIGASAGGLEALEEFFTHVPTGSGMAYVVVTHLHPGHTNMLPELLAKHTTMPTARAEDGQVIEANHVYLSQSSYDLGISNGALRLVKINELDRLRLPIDAFFRALAEDQGGRAVAVVLSGTGSDGTLGLTAVKGAGGLTMAQEPASAKFPGMPESAIATGNVDYVIRPSEMPGQLAAYVKGASHLPSLTEPSLTEPSLTEPSLTEPSLTEPSLTEPMRKILSLLRSRNRHDFTSYKGTTITRRIERRMNLHQLKVAQDYLNYLQDNRHELDLLFRELLIGVTSFFRDPEAGETLAGGALAELIKSKPEDSTVRVWVPGCSTGEEAYSLAILLRETIEQAKKRITVQIFGTDLDAHAIETARVGRYPAGVSVDVTPERLARYFVQEDGHFRVRKVIREQVVFAPQNVLMDPPFSRLDLVSCRNLLIYLKAEAQKRVLALFHYALNPRGILVLGPSESIGEFGDYFTVVDKHWKIFRRNDELAAVHPTLDFSPHRTVASLRPAEPNAELNREPQTPGAFDKLLLNRFAPASVVINLRGDIVHFHGRTGDYLEPSAGQPRLNLFEMAREGLRLELAAAVRRAIEKKGDIVKDGLRVQTNGGFATIRVAVTPIIEPPSMRGLFLVTFTPLTSGPHALKSPGDWKPASKKEPARVQELELDLQFARESLQNTVEELRAANEELQSTNEELQSTNEELETSREEMQSLNEELQTVNAQLQAKVEALSESNDDMQNLLNSTSIATIFLDEQFKIKRFTEQAKSVINLIPSDVGRPIGDLVSNLNYDRLEADAAEVLRTLQPKESEVQTKQGGWRLLRILPYRTRENRIEGLVINCVDITRLKTAELARDAGELAESIVATVREPMLVLDANLRVLSASAAFCRFFQVTRAETEGRLVYKIGNGQWNIPKLRKLLEQVLPRDNTFEDFEMAHRFPGIGARRLVLNGRRLQHSPQGSPLILLAMEDATEKEPKSGRKGK